MNKKQDIRYDEFGEEILYEIRHNLSWWDSLVFGTMFLFGIIIVYAGIEDFVLERIDIVFFITLMLFGIPFVFLSLFQLLYAHKNRIYITNQGIGFERRNWFRMQKGFFKFGEVGFRLVLLSTGLCPVSPPSIITIFPLGNIKSKYVPFWQLKSYCHIFLTFWNNYISPKLYNEITEQCYLHDFLIKKTKEALESQGIDTNSLPYDLEKQFHM
ncbi:hypothetical protein [Helicobacter japonicus]|uniref:hypothetical protein n=1 Tax=Helicobacter japonicus TaxID=425400 RepID=UPI0023F28BF4|nr:hypothetical protein [Helicobacter japonicus]